MKKATPIKFRDYPKSMYTAAQAEWCRTYERETLFEPVMDDYEQGTMSFKQAQVWNVEWFRLWSIETHKKLKDLK